MSNDANDQDTEVDSDEVPIRCEEPPLLKGDVVYLVSTGTGGIIIRIDTQKQQVTIMLQSCNSLSDTQTSHQYRPVVTTHIKSVRSAVQQIRANQADLQLSRATSSLTTATTTAATTRIRHDNLGIRYQCLKFTSQPISTYRWKETSLTCWPLLNRDTRKWKQNTSLSSGEKLLQLMFVEEQEEEEDIFGTTPNHNDILHTFIAMMIGEDIDLDTEFDDAVYETNLQRYKTDINTLQSLSCCCIELRCTVESSMFLWTTVYKTITESIFPLDVMELRRHQHSPKSLVVAYVARVPTCTGCAAKTNFIHALNLKMYCSNCFNSAQLNQELALTNYGQAQHGMTRRCRLFIELPSSYSAQMVRVCLSSLLQQSCQQQTSHGFAVQPISALEHIAEPGKTLPLEYKTTPQGLITAVKVDGVLGYQPLYMEQCIRSIQSEYNANQRQAQRKRSNALITLANCVKTPTSNKRQKNAKEKSINKAWENLQKTDLFGSGTVVTVTKAAHSTTRFSPSIYSEGVVVEFLQQHVPEEVYLVQFGNSKSDLRSLKRSWLQIDEEKTKNAKRMKRMLGSNLN